MLKQPIRSPRNILHQPEQRRGSVLLVVIGLLGMLLLLGITFYSFSVQEQISGTYYADAAKVDSPSLSADTIWDMALEQLIIGTTDPERPHSALWGKRHSLLAGILGRSNSANYDGFDLIPFDGRGVHVTSLATGVNKWIPFVDQDYDNSADPDQSRLNFNYSYAANGGVAPTLPLLSVENTDPDYTAPDINSLYLGYDGTGYDNNTNSDVRVIIPSFHRPQLLRDSAGAISGWQTAASTPQRILRPHPDHLCVNSTRRRFLSVAANNALGQAVQPFPFTPSGMSQGVWDGVSPGAYTYQWDVDNDGDGTREGIWMDIDFPVQTLADGRKFVPLVSFTVKDMDGLINLNVSGNHTGAAIGGTQFANGGHVSASNQGLSRAEISPLWALSTDPTLTPSLGQTTYFNTDAERYSAMLQHAIFWPLIGSAPGGVSRTELANMEALALSLGRAEFSLNNSGTYTTPMASGKQYEPEQYFLGRYGDYDRLVNSQFAGYGYGGASRSLNNVPLPGIANTDDDRDSYYGFARTDTPPGGYQFMGQYFLSQQSGTATPSFVHPLDFLGNGVNLQTSASIGATLYRYGGITGIPGVWPYYADGFSASGPDIYTSFNFPSYSAAAMGNLLPNASQHIPDEPDEIVADWELANIHSSMLNDAIFGPDEMFGLHGSDADQSNLGYKSRLQDLAAVNFRQSRQAASIRQQFTVVSHDRVNFGHGTPLLRRWETDSDLDGTPDTFPPSFPSATTDPFRDGLRRLLNITYNQSMAPSLLDLTPPNLAQLRLNLNKLLVRIDDISNPNLHAPVYRELTPHPVSLPNIPITASGSWSADSPSGSPSAIDQEWWARYDRQRMARDIYVLLYTLGGGNDANTYTGSNSGGVLYTNAQTKEMAQFAVNLVDQLDRDNVITKFEYDRNLGDGWSLDDDPYKPNTPADAETVNNDRGEVYGVEAQSLTLSEVLGIISRRVDDGAMNNPPTYQDHRATQINDSEGVADRFYTYMELRNASPFDVDLSTGGWQIAVVDTVDPDGMPGTGDETEQDRVQLTLISGNVTSIVARGGLFTIGTRGGPPALDPASMSTKNFPSLFRVDTTASATPDFTSASTLIAPLNPNLDLDLIPVTAGANNDSTKFRLTNGVTGSSVIGTGADVTTAGNFLFGGPGGNVSTAQESGVPHKFVLRRRVHLTRDMPVSNTSSPADNEKQTVDNPWIEVDRLIMPTWREFKLKSSDGQTEVQNALLALSSRERAQPFLRGTGEANHAPASGGAPAPNAFRAHTLQGYNSNSPGAATTMTTADDVFTYVQLHFDRDFASAIDLLSVPLYGPSEVTLRVGYSATFTESLPDSHDLTLSRTSLLAQERFLRPQDFKNTPAGGSANNLKLDNRWYRILGLVDVPTRTHQSVQILPYAMRTPGAINLNTIRHRGVLAGLIDDQGSFRSASYQGHLNPGFTSSQNMLVDRYEPGRDWWGQFILARDGIDPMINMILPGSPSPISSPFRSLYFADRGVNSLENTVLRSLPSDFLSGLADRRSLFEARAQGDLLSQGGNDTVDPVSRHRLLRKVHNNSTVRSNVFAVWITARVFEAVDTGGDIQIGAPIPGAKDYRGFFVIDRSLPEQAYSSETKKFDFRKFVQYRKTIQ